MGMLDLPLVILLFSLVIAIIGLAVRAARLLTYPDISDPSPPKASAQRGVVYSFTGGMLPWKKESAYLHWLAYVRGVVFHLGIFTSIVLLLTSLFVDLRYVAGIVAFGPTLGLGFLAGVAAIAARLGDRNLRAISRLDDYISPVLVTLVLLTGLAFVFHATSRTVFWVTVSAMCLYLPWSKIPHSVYFFISRVAFGILFGRRGVIPVPKKIA